MKVFTKSREVNSEFSFHEIIGVLGPWHYDDQRGWLEFKEYDDGKGTSYSYTPAGRLATRTWARLVAGQPLITSYAYNAAGDLADSGSDLAIEYTDATVDVSITRDRLGQINQIIDAAGTHTLTYHANGERETEGHTAGVLAGWSVTRGLDGLLRRNGLTLKEGSTVKNAVSYGYDSASGRLTTVTQGDLVATYAYVDESNLLESTTFTTDSVQTLETTREYDKLNRLTRINNAWPGNTTEPPGNAEFNYDVDNLNQRRKITLEDGSYWMYTYDAKGQVTSGNKYFSDGRVMSGQQFEYDYDEIGNRVKTREGHDATGFNARETTWTANKLNQYESRTVPNKVDLRGTVNKDANILVDGQPATTQAIPSPDGGLKYWHGAATLDNATAPAQKEAQVTAGLPGAGPSSEDLYDQGQKQLTLPKHPEEFHYDDDGNLIQDGLRQYTWDAENRLIAVEPIPAAKWHGAQKATYVYDACWRRVKKEVSNWDGSEADWISNQAKSYIWDDWALVGEVDGILTILDRTWVGGIGITSNIGSILWVNENVREEVHVFSFDGNGNIVSTVAADGLSKGVSSAEYNYDPFGRLTAISGEYAYTNTYRFSSRFQDGVEENGGLIYFGYRYYSSANAAWLSRDVLEEASSLNLSGMLDNNATNYVDLLGLKKGGPTIVITIPGTNIPVPIPAGVPAAWPWLSGLTAAGAAGYMGGWIINQIPGTANLVDELLLGESGKLDGPQPKPKPLQKSSWFLWDARIKPEDGDCGAGGISNDWMVQNTGSAWAGGTLFQNVRIQGNVKPCKDKDGSLNPDSIPKPQPKNDDYSEAWGPKYFPPGGIHKMGSDRVAGRNEQLCTEGKVVITTRAWFTEGARRPPHWGIAPNEPWGGVHGAREQIPYPASSNIVTRTITLDWNCCQGRKKTNITYGK